MPLYTASWQVSAHGNSLKTQRRTSTPTAKKTQTLVPSFYVSWMKVWQASPLIGRNLHPSWYTSPVNGLRNVLLYDATSTPSLWNERMKAGEYAVLYSQTDGAISKEPYCTLFDTLADAEAHARQQTAERPTLRCRIYDHQGLIGAPIRELRGSECNSDSEISQAFRRWVGFILFSAGLGLTGLDWSYDFRLSWPAMIGTRLLIPGLVLLLMEATLIVHAKRSHRPQ